MKSSNKIRLSRLTVADRKSLHICKTALYALIPYGYFIPIVEDLSPQNTSDLAINIGIDHAPNIGNFINGTTGRVIETYIKAIGKKIIPVVNVADAVIGNETNTDEKIESLVFYFMVKTLACNENISNKSLLDCYHEYCKCNYDYVKKYANIAYSVLDKLYLINTEDAYQEAKKHLDENIHDIKEAVIFYLQKIN